MGIEEFKEQQESQPKVKQKSKCEHVHVTKQLGEIAKIKPVDADGWLKKSLKDLQDDEQSKVMGGKEENKEDLNNVEADKLIKNYKKTIEETANKYDVDKYIIAWVIYKEQISQNLLDNFDGAAALWGVDTSIGLGQVKVSTAKKVEDRKYIEWITKKEIQDAGWENRARVARLKNNHWNIKYVWAYLSNLQNIRKGKFPAISSRPDILATVYNNGKEAAHPNPQPSDYGRDVNSLYWHMKQLIG